MYPSQTRSKTTCRQTVSTCCVWMIFILTACGGPPNESGDVTPEGNVSASVPNAVSNALTQSGGLLLVEVVIDQGTAEESTIPVANLNVKDQSFTGQLTIPLKRPGSHTINLAYYIVDPEYGKIHVADSGTVAADLKDGGRQAVDFSSTSLRENFDDDGDGFSNRSEVVARTSPVCGTCMPLPSIPSELTASSLDADAKLDWKPVSGASRYTVYFATEPGVMRDNAKGAGGWGKVENVTPPFTFRQ